ncbi:hypothetical protein BS47DRAFT_1346765 [Hydnum rufescens UP504]|uniref:Uncharacterized protein n=1 Tax=Hydnum rufescens UP504 TaxID=1448309 RepID=A0A9P6AT31_9AGAM|nr:hypothetical protein BS47DRAFT_1346765 [Hydnum rufescens UP504]
MSTVQPLDSLELGSNTLKGAPDVKLDAMVPEPSEVFSANGSPLMTSTLHKELGGMGHQQKGPQAP